jgi:hypothetical protein
MSGCLQHVIETIELENEEIDGEVAVLSNKGRNC